MWPFRRQLTSQDDLRRLEALEEKVESVTRRMASVLEDIDEYFAKINKARQRVNKEDRDAARVGGGGGGGSLGVAEVPREVVKAQLRARMRSGGM